MRIEFPPDEYCNEPVEVIWTIKGSAMLNNLKCGIKSKEVKLKSIVTKEQFENIEYKVEEKYESIFSLSIIYRLG